MIPSSNSTVVRPVQPENAFHEPLLKDFSDFGTKIFFRLVLSAKAKSPSVVTVFGRLSSVMAIPLKAYDPIESSPSLKLIVDNDEQPEKASLPILVTFAGIVIEVIPVPLKA